MFDRVARQTAAVFVVGACAALTVVFAQAPATSDKMPITTTSPEARKLYVDGRDLLERLRVTDGRRLFEQAIARDQNFALAYVGLANTSGTNREFVEAVTKAAALADKVSEGERHQILALEAGLKGDPAGNLTHVKELVRLFPNDERAHTQLGVLYFGRQDYPNAIAEFEKATSINPKFSPPYNQLGYAYKFLEKFSDAETAFKKYTELIPDDPNPSDSYAELLMKMGRFDESIKAYEKALAIDPNFIASHIGIGNNYLAMGQPDKARTAFAKIATVARTTGEKRTARFWAAASYVHEGATDKAIEELQAGYALAEANGDAGSMSGDLTQMGDILREAGRPADALAKYEEAVTVVNKSKLPEEVKEATRRTHVFEEGRVAASRGDIAAARAKLAEYTRQVAPKNRPFEVLQQHELTGMIALAEKEYAPAVQELKLANQQDPRILYLTALALQGAGDASGAATFAAKAAKFNGLNINYGYVRTKARKLAGT